MSPSTHRIARLGLLGSAAVVLFVFESLAPRPLPWMKLGLGNLPVLVSLWIYGVRPGLAVVFVKLLVGGLLSGSLGGPAFILATGAGLASLLAMAAARSLAPGAFSPVGVSVIGGTTHQVTQLLLASAFVAHGALFGLLPVFILGGVASGLLIGLLAAWAIRRLSPAEEAGAGDGSS